MHSRATIVATGAVTSLGLTALETGFFYRTGLPGLREAPIIGRDNQAITMGLVNTLPNELVGWERAFQLGERALEELLKKVPSGARLAITLAVPETWGERVFGEDCGALRLETKLRRFLEGTLGQRVALQVRPEGAAALGRLLSEELQRLEAGAVDLVILGGLHTDYEVARIASLVASNRLYSSEHLDALIPGEGAAMVLLGLDHVVRRLGLPELSRIFGVGQGFERAQPSNDESAYEALGMTTAVFELGALLEANTRRVGWQLNDVSFETFRLFEWQAVSVRAEHLFSRELVVDSPAQRMGHLGAATLPVFSTLVAEAFARGWAPDPLAMILVGSDGGERAAVLLGDPRHF